LAVLPQHGRLQLHGRAGGLADAEPVLPRRVAGAQHLAPGGEGAQLDGAARDVRGRRPAAAGSAARASGLRRLAAAHGAAVERAAGGRRWWRVGACGRVRAWGPAQVGRYAWGLARLGRYAWGLAHVGRYDTLCFITFMRLDWLP